jgi:hypothetical protein
MKDDVHSVYWEAPEHTHIEKSPDWFWLLGIIAITAAIVSIIFNNILFAIVIVLGAVTMGLVGQKRPRIIPYEVSNRGVRIDDTLYPYATLDSFYLDEDATINTQLLLKSKKLFVPLLIVPVPEEHADLIDSMLAERLPEEHLEEPFSNRLLEFLGF